ncbi:thymidylate synthase [Pseudomonas phage vB_PA6_GUMS]|uniref:Thymidylate synthase n=1 Tax=Pseudomonas phage vB_PA6_GUMS TaxID=2656518 RepID=A0A8T8BEZ3_9CAUD|nr:thymidylate synthase [Pseudomonas phage vB_PA6_GUMS]
MKISLISYTQNAWELLLGTKSTRMRGQDPATMTEAEKLDHWKYMLDTIRSPFEFVDFIFQIEGVSKNFTHQLVRTRTGAYQQETSRALEVSAVVQPEAFRWDFDEPATANGEPDPTYHAREELNRLWHDAIADAQTSYQKLLEAGASLQDARAIIPSNMETKIAAKFNLRTLSDMAKVRLCVRTQGEYQEAFREMRRLVLEIYPMFDSLLQPHCVATGSCAFPRYGSKVLNEEEVQEGSYNNFMSALGTKPGQIPVIELPVAPIYQCKFYRPWMDRSAEQEELRREFWGSEKQEANPVAVNGKSM